MKNVHAQSPTHTYKLYVCLCLCAYICIVCVCMCAWNCIFCVYIFVFIHTHTSIHVYAYVYWHKSPADEPGSVCACGKNVCARKTCLVGTHCVSLNCFNVWYMKWHYVYYFATCACVHRNGTFVCCHKWSDSEVKRHTCELQVPMQVDRIDLSDRCSEYGEIRNLAGR